MMVTDGHVSVVVALGHPLCAVWGVLYRLLGAVVPRLARLKEHGDTLARPSQSHPLEATCIIILDSSPSHYWKFHDSLFLR